jgi:hypothetical protein
LTSRVSVTLHSILAKHSFDERRFHLLGRQRRQTEGGELVDVTA